MPGPAARSGDSTRSMTNAARARYPVSSSRLIRKKSRQICGRKTIVPAMPPMMPSVRRSRSGPAGRYVTASSPSRANVASIRSIGTVASANSVQNRPPMTAKNVSRPINGLVNARSSRSVKPSARTDVNAEAPAASASRSSAHAVSASTDASPDGRSRGRSDGGPSSARTSAALSVSNPSPRRATIRTTGTPRRRASRSAFSVRPRRCAMSSMFRPTTTGTSYCSSSPTSTRFRVRLQASTMTIAASGRRKAPSPSSTARAMRDSGASRCSSYTPGRSMISTARSAVSSLRPSRVEVVVPGKLEVFARAPHRRLNVVVLPVFGLPMRATRSISRRAFVAWDGTATATPVMSRARGGRRHDVDLAGHGLR